MNIGGSNAVLSGNERGTSEMSYFKTLLSRYIATAFDNEDDFLCHFLGGEYCEELIECYMASERTRVVFLDNHGCHITATIPTDDFMAWCDER